jgi:hypothetical protein
MIIPKLQGATEEYAVLVKENLFTAPLTAAVPVF